MANLVEETLNYNANTSKEALDYIDYRNKQLLKFGYKPTAISLRGECIVVYYEHNKWKDENWGAIYLLEDERGKGRYLELVEEDNLDIVTLSECGIGQYLNDKGLNYKEYIHSPAYLTIQKFYGSQVAERSQVPYIYHIDEGGGILEYIGASDLVKDAYYQHPIYQADEAFVNNWDKHVHASSSAIALAMEYRHVANSYLSKDKPEDFIGFTCVEVKQMLIADKVQNYKDFLSYHKGNHTRSNELDEYFNNWFKLLNIKYEEIVTSIQL